MSKRNSSRMSNNQTSSEYVLVPGAGGQAFRRIRTPHPHDVLCGRGGGINSHEGNSRFRNWVHDRKNDYNLAENKNSKARVARDVMRLVQHQTPPGRFLMRDPTAGSSQSGWWVEIDETKAMAKTSQALREGAPTIRAQHKEAQSKQRGGRRVSQSSMAKKKVARNAPSPASIDMGPPRPVAPSTMKMSPEAVERALQTAHAAAAASREAGKVLLPEVSSAGTSEPFLATAVTPPLLPASPRGEPPTSFPLPLAPAMASSNNNNMKRTHSLALSDMSNHEIVEDFVNPFEDETSESQKEGETLGTRWRRNVSSSSSHGDLGGIGALLNARPLHRQRSSASFSNNQNGRSLFRNVSSRSSMSEWSDVGAPDEGYSASQSDFEEGMKTVFDAAHTDVTSPRDDGEVIPTHLAPFHGSALTKRLSPKLNRGGPADDVIQ